MKGSACLHMFPHLILHVAAFVEEKKMSTVLYRNTGTHGLI